jgi:hypothetical protein
MPLRPAIALLLVLGAACGGDDASALNPGDYTTQLARITENARIQERGLERVLRSRLESPAPSTELEVVEVHVGQLVRLYQDVIDALTALQPEEALQRPHDAYVAAWQAQLDVLLKVQDAAFDSATAYLDSLEPPLAETQSATRSRCEDLQTAVTALRSDVQLTCAGRPA